MAKRLRVGWFTFTCCEDNAILFVELLNDHFFEWKKVIDFKYCKALKSKNKIVDMDVAFIEGAISNQREEDMAKVVRRYAKKVVATGACACTGMPSAQRNNFPSKLIKEILPALNRYRLNEKVKHLGEVVKVDDFVDGCPMNDRVFVEKVNQYLKEFGVA